MSGVTDNGAETREVEVNEKDDLTPDQEPFMSSSSTAARLRTVHQVTPREHHSMARIFRAFHLLDALSDTTSDAVKVLRGARAFLLGFVLEALAWEEGQLDPGSRQHRCVRHRHAILRRQIHAYGREVWEYQAAGDTATRAPELVTRLRARIVRIQALLDHRAALEAQGGVTDVTAYPRRTR